MPAMRAQRIIATTVLGVALSAPQSGAQAAESYLNHLIPAQDGARVSSSPLLPGPESGTIAAVYCSVPLGAPWAIAIKRNGATATLELREARHVGSTRPGEPELVSSEIPMDLAFAVRDAIEKMVLDARDPEREPMPKREEATVYFISYSGGAARTAWTLSPHPTTPPGRLVELSGMLFTLSQHPSAERSRAATQLARELAGTQE